MASPSCLRREKNHVIYIFFFQEKRKSFNNFSEKSFTICSTSSSNFPFSSFFPLLLCHCKRCHPPMSWKLGHHLYFPLSHTLCHLGPRHGGNKNSPKRCSEILQSNILFLDGDKRKAKKWNVSWELSAQMFLETSSSNVHLSFFSLKSLFKLNLF